VATKDFTRHKAALSLFAQNICLKTLVGEVDAWGGGWQLAQRVNQYKRNQKSTHNNIKDGRIYSSFLFYFYLKQNCFLMMSFASPRLELPLLIYE
jgi:hypothetical protein